MIQIDGLVEVSSERIKEIVPAALNAIKLEIIWDFALKVNKILTDRPTIRCGFLWLKVRKRTYADAEKELDNRYENLEWSERYDYSDYRERLKGYHAATKLNDVVLVNTKFAWYFTNKLLSQEEIKKFTNYSFKRDE